jgi:hypothetical protein
MAEEQKINPIIEAKNQELTDWANAPTVRDLKQDYVDGSPARESQVLKINEWLDNLHVRGKAQVKSREGRSKIVPKLIRKQAEWRYAALSEPFLSTEKLFTVSPATWEDVAAAKQNELVLNHQFNTKVNRVKFFDEYVRTAVDEGTAIVKVLWDFEEEEIEEEVPDVRFFVNPELAPLHEELAALKASNFTEYERTVPIELQQAHELTAQQGVPIEPQVVGTKLQTRMRVVRNQPYLEIVDYRNFTLDPSCKGDISKARFAVHSFETSLAELKADGRYTNLDLINIEASSILGDPDHEASGDPNFNFSDKPRKRFVIHEYWGFWDIDGTGLLKPIVAAWVGDVLVRLEENPLPHKKLPFTLTQYLPVRKESYGEPDGHLLEDNQKVLGAVTRGMIDIMARSANGQMGIRKDALDAVNKRRFEKGLDYQYNSTVDPRIGMYMHTYSEIPSSAQFMMQLQNQEAESLTGVKAFAGGLSGDALGDVATSVRGVLDAASKRELGLLRRLTQGIVDIGRQILAMNAEFLDAEEVVRITNEEFVPVRKDDLEGHFDLKLSISTAEEDNAKAQEMAFMLQTMGNNMDPMIAYKIMAKIFYLRKLPDLAKELEEYQPQPDPMQQKIQELEMLKLQGEIELLFGKVDETRAKVILDQAKAITEQARARMLSSDADLKDLDFVEQESGVKQERQKELHGEQARAQMQLKLLDGYIKDKAQRNKPSRPA